MANEQRDKPIIVKSGKSAPPQRVESLERSVAPPAPEDLDARQARIRETRRRGPGLPPGEEGEAPAGTRQSVPPTDCDDENDR